MTRPAAGGAGGRPAAAHGRPRRSSRPGRWLRVAVIPALLTSAGVLAPPASAAPAPAPDPPVLSAPAPPSADDDASDPDRPVRIHVSRFDPRTITPGSLVSVSGTLTNTGDAPVEGLTVRLQRGELVETRAELAGLDADPDPATVVETAFLSGPASIAPGATEDFSYEVGSEALELDRDGVYPVLLNVNGTVDGDTRRVGELSTFVVQQPQLPAARTAVAWLWPLTERTHRTASGAFADDELARSVSDQGRLDRALAVVERLPSTTPPGSVTLAIDPALVEELRFMAAGEYEVPGGQGSGTDAARTFLTRLGTVAAAHPVVALPYGDVDADALAAAGLGDVVTRSLPGTPEGTAQDPPGSPTAPTTDVPPPPAEESGAPAEEVPAEDGAGARILADVLGIEPRTDLAWAAGGRLRPETLELLRAGEIDRVVLGPGGLTTGDDAVGLADDSAAAAVTVRTPGGPVEGLVADARLTDVVGGAERADGGPRLAEQRYLAELAVLTARATPGIEQTVLVTAPRDVDAGLDGAGAMMAALTSQPWLRPEALSALDAGPRTGDGELVPPADEVRLDAAGMIAVREVIAGRDDLAGAVEGDPDTALQALDAAVARATSVAWRNDPAGFRGATADLVGTLARLRSRVTLLAPADGTYTLASSDAPLVLTVRNDLPFAVRVLPEVRARGSRALSIGDIEARVLAPGERATLQVPASLRQTGGVAVTATLTTPGGNPLGERVQMQVRSTAYGPISLFITIGAASLLALLFLRRLVHYVLRRRARAARVDEDHPPLPADGAALPGPTRSPV